MAELIYDRYKLALLQGDEDWGVSDYRALLLTTLGGDAADVTVADLIAGGAVEASDASYTAGGVALTGETAALDTGVAEATCATIDFTTLDNVTPVAMVIYRFVDGTQANDLLVSHHDTNFGAAANGAGYTVTIGAGGIIQVS